MRKGELHGYIRNNDNKIVFKLLQQHLEPIYIYE